MMKFNNYYNHVDFTKFDIALEDIKRESESFTFAPVRFENPDDVYPWLRDQVTWLGATVNDLTDTPNIKKIIQKLEQVSGSVYINDNKLIDATMGIRFYIQKARSALVEHEDYAETSVALNFTFDDGVAPLTFRDIGDIPYKCCLFNVAHFHLVKPSTIDRLMMRVTPINVNYQEYCEKLYLSGLLSDS
jgi:hypothetical protein